MIKILRDLNDEHPNDTASWLPALADCPPPCGGDVTRWCIAWGQCYASLTSGVRPLVWDDRDNTDEDGVEWFSSLEDATARLSRIESAMNDSRSK